MSTSRPRTTANGKEPLPLPVRAVRSARRRVAARTGRRPVVPTGPAPVTGKGTRPAAAELLPAGAEVYRSLTRSSLFLSAVRTGDVPPAVNLVVPPLDPSSIFAGLATALQLARRLATSLGRPLRVVPFDAAPAGPRERAVRAFLADDRPVPPLSVVPQPLLEHTTVSPDDLWVVTYWTTAHAAEVATRLGVLDPDRVVYFIQDYEPGFHPWSVEHSLTRSTYHVGFHHVVNSAPLSRYLVEREGEESGQGLVLAPHLDDARLERVAAERRREHVTRVFFYARPRKPRNLFALGVTALRAASVSLAAEGVPWRLVCAGEQHEPFTLPGGQPVETRGVLPWDGYYQLLAETDVALSLMFSPHPSHPPLEAAVSGALAVTNDLDGVRSGMHPRIEAVAAEPVALADALADAVRRAAQQGPGGYEPLAAHSMGEPLDTVVEQLVGRLRASR